MPVRLIAKLQHFTRLSGDEREALREAAARRHQAAPRSDIAVEGEEPGPVRLVLDGWACRYRQLPDGRRQIVALLLPGDLCDTRGGILREMDHTVAALTRVSYAEIQRRTLVDLAARHPRLGAALAWESCVAESIQREWTGNLGLRAAPERIGHLLCELFVRLRCVGLAGADACDMPLRQVDLAEATGLTNVHVNRSLKELRAQDLIVLRGRRLTIPDLETLSRASQFTGEYLHLGRDGSHLDANESPCPRGP